MEKTFDVLVIGELNVDLILNDIESFPEMGKEKIARRMSLVMGSSSAIFACNLASLGNRVGFIGKIGEDSFGSLVIRNLEKKKVDTGLIIRDKSTFTGATIVLNFDQERAMVTCPGAMETLTKKDIPFHELDKARHLHLSSFFLQPGIRQDVKEIFKAAREKGLTTSLDIQWDPEEVWDFDYPSVLPHVDVFLPNESEIMALTGESDPVNAIHKIRKYGNTIAVKCGDRGSLLWKDDTLDQRKAYTNDRIVDAIGAGDSFNAGFIHRFLEGAPGTDCLDFGNLAGAISTTAAGGTGAFTTLEHVMHLARTRFNYEK
jgi:sugar/nucleoside kinase (ribokinase family)